MLREFLRITADKLFVNSLFKNSLNPPAQYVHATPSEIRGMLPRVQCFVAAYLEKILATILID